MKNLKITITVFYLIVSFWVTYLIFQTHFVHDKMIYSIDNRYENTLMILLISTLLSMIGVFFLGLLALFTNFVFVKLLFEKNEITLNSVKRNIRSKFKSID